MISSESRLFNISRWRYREAPWLRKPHDRSGGARDQQGVNLVSHGGDGRGWAGFVTGSPQRRWPGRGRGRREIHQFLQTPALFM